MDPSSKISDVNVAEFAVLPAPELLCREQPAGATVQQLIADARGQIQRIIFGDDRRILCIVGPCSIHDCAGGLEYARRLRRLADELADRLYLVMRVYFEKPRTAVGWKGLIMDPHLDGSCDIPNGLRTARGFLLDVLGIGMPTATELLDPIIPQYIADLVCWSAIGARTTESQTHRQMASGLSMPLGFKNGTSGDVTMAFNAIQAARQPQTFFGISRQGLASAVTTRGNANCHLILRGGTSGPNYAADSVAAAAAEMRARGLPPAILIDCSHANSGKDPLRQTEVLGEVTGQMLDPAAPVIGVMLESNLAAGSQPLATPPAALRHGVSITDPCIDWATTEAALRGLHTALGPRFRQ